MDTSREFLDVLIKLVSQTTDGYNRLASALEQSNEIQASLLEKLESSEREKARQTLPLSQAWKILGYKSYQACHHRVQSGHYRLGIEVEDRSPPDSSKPALYLNIPECRIRDKQNPAKRAS